MVGQLDPWPDAEVRSRVISVADAGVRTSYYESTRVADFESLDKGLEATETAVARSLADIVRTAEVKTERDRRDLVLFAATQMLRSPFTRWSLDLARRNLPRLSDGDYAALRRLFPAAITWLKARSGDTHAMALASSLSLYVRGLYSRTALLCVFDDGALITADVPFFFPTGDVLHPDALAAWYCLPLSRRTCVVFTTHAQHDGRVRGDGELAASCNRAMLRMARGPLMRDREGRLRPAWGFAYRHPDDVHVDALAEAPTEDLEAAITDAGRRFHALKPS